MAGEIRFRPERADNVAVARASFRRGLTKRRFWLRIAIALVIAVALGAGMGFAQRGTLSIEPIAWATGAMACWLAILLFGLYLLIPRRAGRLFRQQRTLAHEFCLAWDATGLSQRWDSGALHTPWSDYYDWFEADVVFGFGLNEQLYHFAPKRVMTAEQCADLRAAAAAIAVPSRAD